MEWSFLDHQVSDVTADSFRGKITGFYFQSTRRDAHVAPVFFPSNRQAPASAAGRRKRVAATIVRLAHSTLEILHFSHFKRRSPGLCLWSAIGSSSRAASALLSSAEFSVLALGGLYVSGPH